MEEAALSGVGREMGNGLRIVGLAVGPHSHSLEPMLPPAPGFPISWLPASHQERGHDSEGLSTSLNFTWLWAGPLLVLLAATFPASSSLCTSTEW